MISSKACRVPQQTSALKQQPSAAAVRCLVSSKATSAQAPPATSNALHRSAHSRRALLGILGVTFVILQHEEPSQAQSAFGDSLAQLWRDRQRANKDIYLAPIRVSQRRLKEATDLLLENNPSPDAFLPALQAVRGSSLNCYIYDAGIDDNFETRASLATQQYKFGYADTCTFRLIVKNVSGLLPDDRRREGEKLVESIIMSFQKLDGQLEEAITGDAEIRQQARGQLAYTASLMQQLEDYVAQVLE